MDGATIQQRIYAGRGKAAQRIGLACTQFRPLSAAAPLGNPLGSIVAAFNAGDSKYLVPNLPGDAICYADLDGRLTQPGDYLVRALDGQTWFIAAQQQLLPIITVNCNRLVRFSRQSGAGGSVGLQGYNSTSPCDPIEMADLLGTSAGALWPCSILLGGKQTASETKLPSGVQQAGWKLMLPPSVPVTLQAGDIGTDDLGRRYVLTAAEQSDTGWRCIAHEVHG